MQGVLVHNVLKDPNLFTGVHLSGGNGTRKWFAFLIIDDILVDSTTMSNDQGKYWPSYMSAKAC